MFALCSSPIRDGGRGVLPWAPPKARASSIVPPFPPPNAGFRISSGNTSTAPQAMNPRCTATAASSTRSCCNPRSCMENSTQTLQQPSSVKPTRSPSALPLSACPASSGPTQKSASRRPPLRPTFPTAYPQWQAKHPKTSVPRSGNTAGSNSTRPATKISCARCSPAQKTAALTPSYSPLTCQLPLEENAKSAAA